MSVKRIIVVIVSVLALAGFVTLGISDAVKRNDQLQFQKIQLKSKSVEIQQLNTKYDKLNDDLKKAQDDKSTSQEELDKLKQEQNTLLQEKAKLEQQLSAKIEEKNKLAAASSKVTNAATGTKSAYASTGGNCSQYFAAAGITSAVAMDIINRENRSCNPCTYNNGSGTGAVDCNYSGGNAYGIPQAMPGNKMASAGADWRTNPVTQLKWMQNYVMGRYGSWEGAQAHHDAYGWY